MSTNLVDLDAVTVAGYRLRTGDTTSAASAVTGALVEAEALLDEELRRHLALDERTDSFRFYPDGRIYPDAWPITAAEQTIDGRALLGASPDGGPITVLDVALNRTTVTWTGGYDDGTLSIALPVTLRNAIYDLAQAVVTGADSSLPTGATSVSVGDVSVSFGAGGGTLDSAVPGLSSRVARYRNRWIR